MLNHVGGEQQSWLSGVSPVSYREQEHEKTWGIRNLLSPKHLGFPEHTQKVGKVRREAGFRLLERKVHDCCSELRIPQKVSDAPRRPRDRRGRFRDPVIKAPNEAASPPKGPKGAPLGSHNLLPL